jgi:hypothetical protein
MSIESYRTIKEQQVALTISATCCYARSSNHGSIEQALNEMLDLILALND